MNQNITIRRETLNDYAFVTELTAKAFEHMPFSEGNEDKLVEQLQRGELKRILNCHLMMFLWRLNLPKMRCPTFREW